MNLRRLTVIAATVGLVAITSTPAWAGGSGMPWETPLQSIVDSVQGPVARVVGPPTGQQVRQLTDRRPVPVGERVARHHADESAHGPGLSRPCGSATVPARPGRTRCRRPRRPRP